MTPLTIQDQVMCQHGGKVNLICTDPQSFTPTPFINVDDLKNSPIVGCPFVTPAGVPKPCVKITSADGAGSECCFGKDDKPIALVEKLSQAMTDNGVALMGVTAIVAPLFQVEK